jgi:hypothetical protein
MLYKRNTGMGKMNIAQFILMKVTLLANILRSKYNNKLATDLRAATYRQVEGS